MADDEPFKLPPKEKEDRVISVRLSEDAMERLRIYAGENMRSMGSVARAMIEHVISGLRISDSRDGGDT